DETANCFILSNMSGYKIAHAFDRGIIDLHHFLRFQHYLRKLLQYRSNTFRKDGVMTQPSKTYTISARLWTLGSCLLVTVALIGALSYWSVSKLSAKMSEMVDSRIPEVKNMGMIDMMHDGIRGNAFGAIIASINKDDAALADIKKEADEYAKEMNEHMTAMENLDLSPAIREALGESKGKIDSYTKAAAVIVSASLTGDTKLAISDVPVLQKAFEVLEDNLGKLGDLVEKEASASGIESIATAKDAIRNVLLLTLFGFAIGITVCIYFIRSINQEFKAVISDLSRESENVGHTAESLSQSASALATETTQQASALQETASSMDEIAAMVKLTTDNSNELEKAAKQSFESAGEGQHAIRQMLTSISSISSTNDRVMSQVEDNNRQISEIVQMMGEISSKTKVINDIVFQTKLLSFNASVEAARAGEHGKGFAVVAEEVGNLARMSGNAAKEITDLLDSSVHRVEDIVAQSKRKVDSIVSEAKTTIASGVTVAKQCDTALNNIVKQSGLVNERITAITQAIREQDQGVSEVSKALRILDQSTNQNEATAKETRSNSDHLLNQARNMDGIVQRLEALSGIKSSSDLQRNEGIDPHAHQVTPENLDRASSVVRKLKPREDIHVNHDDRMAS
ncbi:MAG: methyl-accepting chemotaxis protein, partial [Proteobacteria bacterium]|nr:methyl-accepting chemotaxis protein [Pseudomonadota bacterium]